MKSYILLAFLVYICHGRKRLEDPKDIIGMNAHRRAYYQDAEYTELGKQYKKGTIWPKPQFEKRSDTTVYRICPQNFKFTETKPNQQATGRRSDSLNTGVVKNAISRYTELTFPNKDVCKDGNLVEKDDEIVVTELRIDISDYEEPLFQDMNENYTLQIDTPISTLKSTSVWGALRGLETFSQIVVKKGSSYKVAKNYIKDFPRFSYRGFLVDTSRHFLPVPILLQFIDALAYSKFNVLHWHIVDDPSFPYESRDFPELSAKGAFTKHHVYSQEDVRKIIDYSRLRGIRVMPEFDTPGHVHSWGGQPGLLTDCEETSLVEDMFQDLKGPINPVRKTTYEFLEKFFREISEVFPEALLHLGGDEVDFKCWESNQGDIKKWLEDRGPEAKVTDLHTFFLNKLVNITKNLDKINVVWQEVFDDKVKIEPKSTIVNVWKQENWKEEMGKVTKAGFQTILSSPWYLNYISYGLDWPKFYKSDPQDFAGSQKEKDLVIGGSACMWGEYADATNVIQRSFGRGFAVAERLWSNKNVKDVKEALPRIWEHRCRYISRGIPAEPVTKAKFCSPEWGE